MEVIKERRGRAYAGKRGTRPVTVRYRTVPILTQDGAERLRCAACAAAMVACVLATGVVEGSTWPM